MTRAVPPVGGFQVTRTVTVTVARLRGKLGKPDVIETVVGCGYRLP